MLYAYLYLCVMWLYSVRRCFLLETATRISVFESYQLLGSRVAYDPRTHINHISGKIEFHAVNGTL